ncbi:unnamed protein product [Microthlaspi erraticum]|uniref:Uncharacterized protein n=1 Tax=Microthlaspi erraticum TaxID=1685480 RepID=A0A6D2I2A9_9BRAS|nr:unnamed protein product [Microthlaspi erraticum]
MIIEDERDTYRNHDCLAEFQQGEGSARVDGRVRRRRTNLQEILNARTRVRDRKVQQQLKKDLVEHIWQRHLNGQDVDDNDDAESGDEVYDEDEIADEDHI